MARITCSELLERGDLAATTGDRSTLSRVASLLARRVGDPIAARLLGLARACRSDVDDVRATWTSLRTEVVVRIATAGT